MQNLVTHIRPHLDDICGIWLYRKYVPGWKQAAVRFIPTSSVGGKPYGGQSVDSDSNVVHIGVCRGRYDEHKGDIGKSAAVLVWEDLRRRGLLPKDKIKFVALKKVIDFVLEEDLGLRFGKPGWQYEPGTLVMWVPDSNERVRTGSILLEALLSFATDRAILDRDWQERKEFKTKWGTGVGITSTVSGKLRAYDDGFTIIAQVDPKRGYRSLRAKARSRVNLTNAYQRVKTLEPKADWYLHHSKKLLICGDDVAPRSRLSKLTLEELISLVRS